MATTTIRIDDNLKNSATLRLEKLGLNLNAYVNMALVQLVNQNKIPFELSVGEMIISPELKREMLKVEAIEAGLLEDDGEIYDRKVARKRWT